MRYRLSESTISLIQGENISQQELVRKIDELYENDKVSRTFSQQSVSRYLNGKSFPNEDTENIILLAVRTILGARKFRMQKKIYQIKLEEEQKDKEIEKKKAKKKSERNSSIGIGLRELISNEKYKDMLMSDEEIDYYEEQKEQAETRQIIEFWRSAPVEIQEFWLEIVGISGEFSKFIKEILLSMIGVEQQVLLDIANHFYFQYCTDNIYGKYANDFSDDELQIMGKLVYASGKAHEKLYEFVQEGSDIYSVLMTGECGWKICDNEEKYITTDEKERRFLQFYEHSKMTYEEFQYYASLLVCMEKVDWLVIHMAFLLEKSQKNNLKKLFEGYMWITEAQEDLIYTLRALQPQDVKESKNE